MQINLRKPKTEKKYEKLEAFRENHKLKCPLCKAKNIKKFKYWKIIKNDFPYDRIASRHDMLVPIRHATEEKLNRKEQAEYKKIKETYLEESSYDYFLEVSQKGKSIPSHFHMHLIVLKKKL